MIDRIVISLLIGVVGGFLVWGAMALVLIIDNVLPWEFLIGAMLGVSIAAFIIDIRTRTNDQ